jgi:protein-L-isoaspartate(D-aspartate) O-methyltransferase
MKEPISIEQLVALLKAKGIQNTAVLAAMLAIPRHLFVKLTVKEQAYTDTALSLSHGQTISQPYVVAAMTETLLARQTRLHKVLEIGTGSGYQAAVLSQVVDEVYTIERIKPLLEDAQQRFADLGLTNICLRFADGNKGWPEAAPFDGIMVTAASDHVPDSLLEQLADGGCLVIPVGKSSDQQALQCITRTGDTFITEEIFPVVFVPLLRGTEEK